MTSDNKNKSLSPDILNIIAEYATDPVYKFLDWIDSYRIDWNELSSIPEAGEILKQRPNDIEWIHFSEYNDDIDFFRQHFEKICWTCISGNPHAIVLLKENR